MTSGGEGRRGALIAIASTVVFFTLLGVLITHAPGWPEVRRTFFDWGQFKDTLPEIARAFRLNVKIFLIAEAFILVFALVLAVIRSLPGPAACRIGVAIDGDGPALNLAATEKLRADLRKERLEQK